MTKDNQDRGLAPLASDGQDGGGGPLGQIRDPLAAITDAIGDDPSLGELVAFRDSRPDLALFAREAKRCEDEADRLPYSLDQTNEVRLGRIGLRIVALSCTAMVAIWPVDTVAESDAKRTLAHETRLRSGETDYGMAAMLSVEDAARIRLHRAAFAVGELIVPPAPPPPSADDRGLARWPLSRLDLVYTVPLAGGDASLDGGQVARWAAFTDAYPTISDCVDRFARMIAIADRLDVLAEGRTEDAPELRRGAEGARILAYLATARAAIWPAMRYSADAQAKLRLVELVNERACRRDPLHQQAAIRHIVSEANWIAKAFRLGATLELEPDWIPIV
ncbi:hypothetical protein [Bosea sp. ANAM02]|uniref:hypothetical protein n=1 Tax=Bosea sp. ANAM02 TaxID=2020412 RepID=UPI00140F0838|nr:hypothetical protein [Bosea sp. ANAM02]BCB18686.1 hypothetical protein OCUBac02_15800 [Bosea sp. ANAM02]